MSPASGEEHEPASGGPAGGDPARFPSVALLPVALAVATALLVVVRANVHFMTPSPALLQQFDEAYATAFARRMLEGSFLPYVDAVSHRGPLYYTSVAAAVKAFGNGTWMPVRVLSLVTMTATIALGFAAAWRARRPVAGAVFSLVHAGVLCVAMSLDGGLAYNSEQLVCVFAMASLLGLVAALGPSPVARRVPWAAFSGFALAASGLTKQTGFALLVPFGLWIVAAAAASKVLSPRERKAIPVAFALGMAAPVVALAVRYAAAGELGTLYYYLVTYNAQVYLAAFLKLPSTDFVDALRSHFYVALALSPLVGWVILSPFAEVRAARDVPRAYAERGFEVTVGVAALLAPFAADASLRDLEHYYVQVVPWAGLLLGVVVERLLLDAPGGARAWLGSSVALLPLTLAVEVGWHHRVRSFAFEPGYAERFTTGDTAVCRLLRQYTLPGESLFVWGFFPAPYTACDRRPASRYVYTTFVSGFVPHVVDSVVNDAARVVPGSRAILERELTRDPPAAILDAPVTLGLRSLVDDPFLKEFVAKHYCEVKADVGPWMRAFIRNGRPGCQTVPSPPSLSAPTP